MVTYHPIDAKDGTNVDTSIDIAATVERVKDDAIFTLVSLLDKDRFFVFL